MLYSSSRKLFRWLRIDSFNFEMALDYETENLKKSYKGIVVNASNFSLGSESIPLYILYEDAYEKTENSYRNEKKNNKKKT